MFGWFKKQEIKRSQHGCCPFALTYLVSQDKDGAKVWKLRVPIGTEIVSISVTYCPWCGKNFYARNEIKIRPMTSTKKKEKRSR